VLPEFRSFSRPTRRAVIPTSTPALNDQRSQNSRDCRPPTMPTLCEPGEPVAASPAARIDTAAQQLPPARAVEQSAPARTTRHVADPPAPQEAGGREAQRPGLDQEHALADLPSQQPPATAVPSRPLPRPSTRRAAPRPSTRHDSSTSSGAHCLDDGLWAESCGRGWVLGWAGVFDRGLTFRLGWAFGRGWVVGWVGLRLEFLGCGGSTVGVDSSSGRGQGWGCFGRGGLGLQVGVFGSAGSPARVGVFGWAGLGTLRRVGFLGSLGLRSGGRDFPAGSVPMVGLDSSASPEPTVGLSSLAGCAFRLGCDLRPSRYSCRGGALGRSQGSIGPPASVGPGGSASFAASASLGPLGGGLVCPPGLVGLAERVVARRSTRPTGCLGLSARRRPARPASAVGLVLAR
jgi:hypothetical protein